MRRILESQAVDRSDEDPFAPRERSSQPQAMRSVPATWVSRRLLPQWLCLRAISVSVRAPTTPVSIGDPVPIRITLTNTAPIPITITVSRSTPWTWAVDGYPTATKTPQPVDGPDHSALHFDRGERKQFTRRWWGYFRVAKSQWTAADPGSHTISVSLGTEETDKTDHTTVILIPRNES